MYISLRLRALYWIAILALLLGSASLLAEDSDADAGEQIKWQVIGNGATDGASANYNLKGTVGQAAIGSGSSTNYGLNQGYWQSFSSGSCQCGDADGNGQVSITDAVFIINFIFGGGAAPNPLCLADADGNGQVSITDAVYIINFIFGGGPAPGGC